MTMKKLAFILVLPMVAAVAYAQEPPQPPPGPPGQSVPDPGQSVPQQAPSNPQPPVETPAEPETTSTKEVPAEVVSADAAGKSINVKVMVKKDATSEPQMTEGKIPVDAEALPSLDTVSPGDKVKLLCRMNGTKVIAVKGIKPQKP